MKILVINCGSSSLKYQLIDMTNENVEAKGICERIGIEGSKLTHKPEGKDVLVDFWAPWCSYCRRIGPAFEKVAEQYQEELVVGKINIDEEPELADKYNIEVIPSLVYFRDGKPEAQVVAPQSKAQIDEFIAGNRK